MGRDLTSLERLGRRVAEAQDDDIARIARLARERVVAGAAPVPAGGASVRRPGAGSGASSARRPILWGSVGQMH